MGITSPYSPRLYVITFMQSEYKNFLLNVVYQVLTFIFPLFTIPYISRILGVDNVGIYSYTYSIVNMFILLGMLGLNNYGNREIAKVRDDKLDLSKRFCSIYGLQLVVNIFSIICYIIYLSFFCTGYKTIANLQIIYLISILFDVNWFYFGMEKFKMTITRNLIIKVVSIILIFTLIKEKSDLWIYTIIIALSTLLSQLYLFINLPNFVDLKISYFNGTSKHIKSVLLLFIPVLAYSIYRVMDKIMIGSLSSMFELGNYENAEKLINIPIAIITALGTVMLPRMAYLFANKQADVKQVIFNSMNLILLLSTIMSFGLFLISNEISLLMFGTEFTKSGIIIRSIAVTIIISAWANVVRTQLIIPRGYDSIYVKSTIGGALVNILFNIILIPLYGALGACVGTVLAELYVMLYQSFICRKELELRKYFNLLLKYSFHSSVIVLIAFLASYSIDSHLFSLVAKIGVSIILFAIIERKYIWCTFLGRK